ncbi:hypothetical protein ACFFGT_00065 [Mucilaginibacter angelicae]|uniref:Peptidase n=1 Tax=Mucilaginibacter angelicae TaxID=869718 RepID=A0ABV6KYK5_9SPHI
MNKILYTLLIVFLGITTAFGIWNVILTDQTGAEIYKLNSYTAWFLWGNITAIAGSILLLKYYLHNNYRPVFLTGVIAVIANTGYVAVCYINLISGGLRSYYMPALAFYLCAIIVYTVSLIFSNLQKRYWLRLAGVCGLIVTLVVALASIGSAYSKDVRIIGMLQKIIRGGSIASCMINAMFIMNFLDEITRLKNENANVRGKKYLEPLLGLSAVVAVVMMITIGTSLAHEGGSQPDWQNYNAEQAQVLVKLAGGDRTFVDSDGDSLHYILIKPQNYDRQKKYPLVVCLPYGGYEASAAESLAGIDGNTHPAFIFVPYCPKGAGWGGISGTASLESLVYEAISGLNEPGIDIKRRYVTGVSRGGYGTWQFICTRPDLFAAAIPICGGGDPELASKIVNMPIWAFHGAKDRNVPVSGSRDMISAIKKAGGHPRYTEYADRAHNIWDKVIETPGLWDWLFAQKRE